MGQAESSPSYRRTPSRLKRPRHVMRVVKRRDVDLRLASLVYRNAHRSRDSGNCFVRAPNDGGNVLTVTPRQHFCDLCAKVRRDWIGGGVFHIWRCSWRFVAVRLIVLVVRLSVSAANPRPLWCEILGNHSPLYSLFFLSLARYRRLASAFLARFSTLIPSLPMVASFFRRSTV